MTSAVCLGDLERGVAQETYRYGLGKNRAKALPYADPSLVAVSLRVGLGAGMRAVGLRACQFPDRSIPVGAFQSSSDSATRFVTSACFASVIKKPWAFTAGASVAPGYQSDTEVSPDRRSARVSALVRHARTALGRNPT